MAQYRRVVAGARPHASMLRETIITAVIGASVVALWFLATDILRGQIFFTPAALGSAIFLGARGMNEVEISALTVIGYTFLHGAAFLAVAALAVVLFRAREVEPRAILGAVLLFVTMEVFVIGVLAILAGWLLDALSLWSVALSTLVAALAMALFLRHQYPAVQDELRSDLEGRQ